MSDKTIKHFIFSRFFPVQDPKYPYDIYDVDFLSKQLPLAKNMLSSLENQTNKNFDLIFLMNEKFFDNPTYEFLFKTLQDSTTLPIKFIKGYNYSSLQFKKLYDTYDFIIESKMDFDDFVYKNAIEDTQNKINECSNLLIYGYCKGYTYAYGDLYRYDYLWSGVGHIGILQSLILKSSFGKEISFFTVNKFSHHNIKSTLKNFLEENDIAFSEDMFQQNFSVNAYIYFRHDFSHNELVTTGGMSNISKRRQKVTTADITKKQLEEEFGFTGYELNSIK